MVGSWSCHRIISQPESKWNSTLSSVGGFNDVIVLIRKKQKQLYSFFHLKYINHSENNWLRATQEHHLPTDVDTQASKW